MSKPLPLYLIRKHGEACALFSPLEAIEALEEEHGDRVRQAIDWVARRKNRLIAWLGRMLRSLHDYYVKLEDRIDPAERVLKAMASVNCFIVHTHDQSSFQTVLQHQRRKHIFWFSVDFVITGVVVIFTPLLAPIPGPNIFFYFPFYF